VQIAAVAPGTSVNLEIWRNHATREVASNSVRWRSSAPPRNGRSAPGRRQAGTCGASAHRGRAAWGQHEGRAGVERATGPAAEPAFSRADVVAGRQRSPLNNAEELRSAVEKSKGHIALLIQRGETRLFVPVTGGLAVGHQRRHQLVHRQKRRAEQAGRTAP